MGYAPHIDHVAGTNRRGAAALGDRPSAADRHRLGVRPDGAPAPRCLPWMSLLTRRLLMHGIVPITPKLRRGRCVPVPRLHLKRR
jgi:hypothetical protein